MLLTGFHPVGVKLSHYTYRPSPTKDVTEKDSPLIRDALIGGDTVFIQYCTVFIFYIIT
jgi:hypothetical protein